MPPPDKDKKLTDWVDNRLQVLAALMQPDAPAPPVIPATECGCAADPGVATPAPVDPVECMAPEVAAPPHNPPSAVSVETPTSGRPPAGVQVACMLLKLEVIVGCFIDALHLSLSQARDTATRTFDTTQQQAESAISTGQWAAGAAGSGLMSDLARDGFALALKSATEAVAHYEHTRAEIRRQTIDLRQVHDQLMTMLDAAVARSGGVNAEPVRGLRGHAECVYHVTRHRIRPEELLKFSEVSGGIVRALRDTGSQRCRQAGLYADAPLQDIQARFDTTLHFLVDLVSAARRVHLRA